jgi:8-oxo-dGTP diphosphatase
MFVMRTLKQPTVEATVPRHDLAAGGLVERRNGDLVEIAIVARRRYGPDGSGDHALPKGHLEAGESWQQAALREVEEETGCRCEIVGPPSTVSYMAAGVPKLVVFFPMRCLEQARPKDTREVREVEWLAPVAAVLRMSYPVERELVQLAYLPPTASERIARVLRALGRKKQGGSSERFRAAAWELRFQLKTLPGAESRPAWFRNAEEGLEQAERLAQQGDAHSAWTLLKLARRQALHALAGNPRQLAVQGERLLAEASEKLTNWRKIAVTGTLATPKDEAPTVEQLIEAQAFLDEHLDNTYYKLRLSLQRLMVLPWLILAALAVLWLSTVVHPVAVDAMKGAGVLASGGRLFLVALMGMLGALLSLAVTTRATSKRIPEELSKGNEVFLRIMIGSASAVAVSIAIEAGLLGILNTNGPSLFLAAIAAGFTDRLLNGVLNGIESGANK